MNDKFSKVSELPAILEALPPTHTMWNNHLSALNEHFLYILSEYDKVYSQTDELGTQTHLENKANFARDVAIDLAESHADRGYELIDVISSRYIHEPASGPVIEVLSSTGFNGFKPDPNAAHSIHI